MNSETNRTSVLSRDRVPVDPDALRAFMERFAADQAATVHAATVVIGDQLGLYRALADDGPQTAGQLAAATGCQPRLVGEWLNAQVASAYCEHENGSYWLTPEQAACLADPSSPTYVASGSLVISSSHKDTERVREAFLGNGAISWHEHHTDLFEGTRRFFEPVYRANLVANWVPALEDVADKLETGARVADVGCGHGAPLILLAQAYPGSTFAGYDYHAESIEAARANAAEAGVSDRVTFEVAGADDFGGHDFDLVCVFNALHEWGDPIRAARHIRESLAPDGTWMFTEPLTDDDLVPSVRARTFYSVSTFVCTPSALSQDGGESLGAQAGEGELRRVVTAAGFSRFRRATETPSFMVLEARP
ncbi:MAG: class I SAM-dependent methyltransferase [Ilumatobacter sp.]|nr:MAG: class I SAM-dependent methyltransferase [Ilumatobacter sp.]